MLMEKQVSTSNNSRSSTDSVVRFEDISNSPPQRKSSLKRKRPVHSEDKSNLVSPKLITKLDNDNDETKDSWMCQARPRRRRITIQDDDDDDDEDYDPESSSLAAAADVSSNDNDGNNDSSKGQIRPRRLRITIQDEDVDNDEDYDPEFSSAADNSSNDGSFGLALLCATAPDSTMIPDLPKRRIAWIIS